MQTEIKANFKGTAGGSCLFRVHLEAGDTDTSFPRAFVEVRTANGLPVRVPLGEFHRELERLCVEAYDMRRVVRFPGLLVS